MYLVTNDEMKRLDQKAIDEIGLPSVVLMENAGIAILNQMREDIEDLENQDIAILCGTGNNGGDGMVLARQLFQKGHRSVTVFLCDDSNGQKASDENKIQQAILKKLHVKLVRIHNESQLTILKAQLSFSTIIVDCLYGTGISRELGNLAKKIIESINQQQAIRIAVDIPSGVNGSTGEMYGAAVKADFTYTLAYPKLGLYLNDAVSHVGKIRILDIGIPAVVEEHENLQGSVLQEQDLGKKIELRPYDGYKNAYGHVGVLAGSLGMSGACHLTIKGAFRSGCGLVSALVDQSIYAIVAGYCPEAMIRPVTWPNTQAVDWLLEKTKVQIVGPGWGISEEKQSILEELLSKSKGFVVIDADALSMLANGDGSALRNSKATCVITPHPGEMARLLGLSVESIQQNRLLYAKSIAQKFKCYVVLKGYHSIIAAPDGRFAINTVESTALSTAGSGDVLSGVIASFLVNMENSFEAICTAVLTHGMAGCFLEKKLGVKATMATDIADAVGSVLNNEYFSLCCKGIVKNKIK